MKLKITIVLLFLIISSTFAQFHNYSVKYGIQGHFLIHDTDFDNDPYRFSHQARGFLRFELFSGLEAELGVGMAKLTAFDFFKSQWATTLIPADLRLVFAPFNYEKVNPYVYGGFGSLRWNVQTKPKSVSPKLTKESGWTQFVPVGGGVEIAVSDDFLLGFAGGYNFTFSDDLNYYNNGNANDGYFDFESNAYVKHKGNRYTSTRFLRSLKSNSWKSLAEHKDYGLLKVQKDFPETKVVVVGVNPKSQSLD